MNDLHKVIDDIHASLDALKGQREDLDRIEAAGQETAGRVERVESQLDELRKAIEEAEQDYKRILERAMWLDRVQTGPEKDYRSRVYTNDPRRRELRRQFVEYCLDLAHYRMTGKPLTNGELFRAQTIASDGGALVPAEHAAEIVAILDSFGLVRQRARRFPMNSDTLKVPTGTVPVVTWQTTENVAPAESSASFTPVTLNATRALAINTLSLDIRADSTPSIVDYLMDVYTVALAKEEDTQGLTGTGSPFTGILGASGVASVTGAGGGTGTSIADEISYDVLVDLSDAVDEALTDNGIYVGSRKVISAILKLKDSQNRPIFAGDPSKGLGNLFGFEFVRSSVMPTTVSNAGDPVMLFGDMSHLAFGDREELSIEFSPAAGFTTASVVMRLTERVAMAVLNGTAFAKLVKS